MSAEILTADDLTAADIETYLAEQENKDLRKSK